MSLQIEFISKALILLSLVILSNPPFPMLLPFWFTRKAFQPVSGAYALTRADTCRCTHAYSRRRSCWVVQRSGNRLDAPKLLSQGGKLSWAVSSLGEKSGSLSRSRESRRISMNSDVVNNPLGHVLLYVPWQGNRCARVLGSVPQLLTYVYFLLFRFKYLCACVCVAY